MAGRLRIILQARSNSSRLPGKVLLPIGGLPLALLCARRLANRGRELWLATSDDARDDLLARTASQAGIQVFRGSLDDVLGRYVQASADLDVDDVIVRATADNPLPDGAFIDRLLQLYQRAGTGYLGPAPPSDGLPYGLSAEVFSVAALREVAASTDPHDREHVTPGLRRQAGSAGLLKAGQVSEQDHSALRATVDTLEDYLGVAAVFQDCPTPLTTPWQDLLSRLPRAPALPAQAPLSSRDRHYSAAMLGTVQLGLNYGVANGTGRPDDAAAAQILALAAQAGITHLDTARVYGDAETRIGQFLPAGARGELKLITKLQPLSAVPDDAPEREVRAVVDASVLRSCRELRRRCLDVLMFHRSADLFRWSGAAAARLRELQAEGVIGELGVSVYSPEEALRCLQDPDITQLQLPFNVLDTRWLVPEFQQALAQRPQLKVHTRSAFLQGLLLSAAAVWPAWVEAREDVVARLEQYAQQWGRRNRADLCLAYARSQPWITSLVLGVETAAQLQELLALLAAPPLEPVQVQELARAFSGVPTRLLNPALW